MAVNETRSMNADLREGLTDGSVKKVNPNRGGFPNDDMSMSTQRQNLSHDLYDVSTGNSASSEMADRLTTVKG